MNDYAVQLLIRMLKIYSPSGKEKALSDFLAKEMKKLGFTDKKMLNMLQKAIDEDQKKGLNKWGGKYSKGEKPPSIDPKYWEKW